MADLYIAIAEQYGHSAICVPAPEMSFIRPNLPTKFGRFHVRPKSVYARYPLGGTSLKLTLAIYQELPSIVKVEGSSFSAVPKSQFERHLTE
jgi:hypothetical protein